MASQKSTEIEAADGGGGSRLVPEWQGYCGGLLATNGYALRAPAASGGGEDSDVVVLVDAPRGIADWAASRGWRVGCLLLTHQHFDHIEDAAEVARRFGCPIRAFAPFDRVLTLEDLFGGFGGISLEIEPFEVDDILAGREVVTVGGCTFRLLHVPGHSPDSLCFHDEAGGILCGGDVLMAGGIGRCDFPGGDGRLLVEGIREKLLPLDDSVVVLPGHGPVTTIGAERRGNPFL